METFDDAIVGGGTAGCVLAPSALGGPVRNGRRVAAASAYLAPARSRANLAVRTRRTARRILFAGTRATRVEYAHRGGIMQGHAAREVLRCAGTIASPQILMLSGIGDAHHLGIEVVADRPAVGRNLQEHVRVQLIYRATVSFAESRRPRLAPRARRVALRALARGIAGDHGEPGQRLRALRP